MQSVREIVHPTLFTRISLLKSARRTSSVCLQREKDKGTYILGTVVIVILQYYYAFMPVINEVNVLIFTIFNVYGFHYRCTFVKNVDTPPMNLKCITFISKRNTRTVRRCSSSMTRDTSNSQTQTLPTCCFKYAPNIGLIAIILLDWPKC